MATEIDLIKNSEYKSQMETLIDAVGALTPMSPIATVTKAAGVATITVIDANGTTTAQIHDGDGNGDMLLDDFSTIRRDENYVDKAVNALTLDGKASTFFYSKDNLDVFEPSGSGATKGLVPQPPALEGKTKFLCEDGTWKLPGLNTEDLPYTRVYSLVSEAEFNKYIVNHKTNPVPETND